MFSASPAVAANLAPVREAVPLMADSSRVGYVAAVADDEVLTVPHADACARVSKMCHAFDSFSFCSLELEENMGTLSAFPTSLCHHEIARLCTRTKSTPTAVGPLKTGLHRTTIARHSAL